ncbi:hypothetical protein ACFPRL_13425 [Pseudoclavibacter helvolus]
MRAPLRVPRRAAGACRRRRLLGAVACRRSCTRGCRHRTRTCSARSPGAGSTRVAGECRSAGPPASRCRPRRIRRRRSRSSRCPRCRTCLRR